jgi:hypothetical protein
MGEQTLQEFLESQEFDTDEPESQERTRGLTLSELLEEQDAEPVDTSPIPIDRTRTTKQSEFSQMPVPSPFEMSSSDPIVIAASNGIDFTTGAQGGHLVAGFAIDRDNERLAYAIDLEQRHGKPVRTRIGPQTKRVEYLNPNTNRWTLTNPLGIGNEDAARSVGPAMALGLDAFVVGAAVGTGGIASVGSVALFSAVSTPSAIVSEGMRIYIGNQLGINQNVDDLAVAKHLGIVGGVATVGGLAGEAGVRSGIAFYRWLGLDVSTRSLVREFGMDLGEAIRISEGINERIVGAEFQLRLGQSRTYSPSRSRWRSL